MRRPASLQGRLLLLVILTSVGVWLAAAALAWRDARHEMDELLDAHLAQAAALLVARQAHPGDEDERVDAPSLHRYAPRVAFQVFHEGRLALRSAQAPAQPLVGDARSGRQGFHTVLLQGEPWRVFATHGGESDVQVFVAERLRARASILAAVLRSMLWPLALALPLLGLAGWWAVRQGVRPLRALGSALARRDAGDLQPVQAGPAPSEMQPLVAALNGLLQRMGEGMERERRFTADAAHELRTPIAAIRAQVQVALAAQDETQRRHALSATLAGCDRASRLVEQLLTLSRLEAGASETGAELDLARVVQSVVAQLAPASVRKQQALSLDAEPGCRMRGDETLLAVLARNLVDNAIRYTPAQGRIQVAVERRGGEVLLRVEDSGPGLAPEQAARLGERFFRAPGAAEAGSGLGWSIVRRVAAAHGGSLQVEPSPLGGLRAIARFPGAVDAAMRK